jgi:hypothetical protein
MISMWVPGVAQMIQIVLLNLIQVDILMTDKWVQSEMLDRIGLTEPQESQINKEDEEEHNFFEDNGYPVGYLLGNLGSTLIFLIISLIAYIIVFFVYFFGKCFLKCKRFSNYLNNIFLWDFAI